MTATIKTWSYSAWKEYMQCPFKSKLKRIDHLREPGSPAMDRGTAIHQLAQDYVEGKFTELPHELRIFHKQFAMLKDRKATCELEWGFTNAWKSTGFNSPDVWLRVKTDATFKHRADVLTIIDHKTGRIYDDHHDQLHLYATVGFILNPDVQTIIAQDWYLDQDAMTEDTFQRNELPGMIALWNERVRPMLTDDTFPMRPGPLCRYCHFRKANFGPCDF